MSYRLTKLETGLRILTVSQPEALSVSVMVLANAGAKNEDDKDSGISHFLEHMGFKGTERRPKSIDLSSEFDAIGASFNAFTCHDSTAYHLTVIPAKVELAVDLLSDMYLHSTLTEAEIKKERGVIIEEIKMYEDKPTSFVWDVFAKLAYAGTLAGRLVLGERETVSALTREDLVAYRAKHYSAQETIIIVVGNFAEDRMIKLVSEKFSSLPTGEKIITQIVTEDQLEPRLKLVPRSIEQSHFVLGFKSASLADEKIYPLTVLACILGGGMSSRLFQKVREDLGLAYYIGADQNSSLDHGFWAVSAGVEASKLNLALEAVVAEIKKIKIETVPAEELNRAKDHLVGGLFLGLERPADQTYFYGEQMLEPKEILTPQQLAEKVRAVTAEELKVLANEIFQADRLSLAIVGPDCSLTEIRGIIRAID
ncbi:MAG: pitrilysin family protein [Candidatus Paceibacterota bacterium]|jgi:predicted Zn-dependent peptidase